MLQAAEDDCRWERYCKHHFEGTAQKSGTVKQLLRDLTKVRDAFQKLNQASDLKSEARSALEVFAGLYNQSSRPEDAADKDEILLYPVERAVRQFRRECHIEAKIMYNALLVFTACHDVLSEMQTVRECLSTWGAYGNESKSTSDYSTTAASATQNEPVANNIYRLQQTVDETLVQMNESNEQAEGEIQDLSHCINRLVEHAAPSRIIKGKADVTNRFALFAQLLGNCALEGFGHKRFDKMDSLYIPIGPLDKEGVQPIIHALLRAVSGRVLKIHNGRNGGDAHNDSPLTTDVRKECVVAWDPRIDFAVGKDKALPGFVDGTLLDFAIVCNCLDNANKSRNNAFHQVLGHLAQRVMVSFDFGDCGVDATATGAIVTLVDIEVLQLKVTELGRATSPIHLISSGKLPLLSKENVVKLLTSSLNNKGKRKGKGVNRAFLDALYPPGCDENERALAGMKALWVILSSPSLRFFAEAWTEKAVFVPENQSRVEYSLDKRLGAGGFGLVYSFKDEKETVLKVARYMKSKSLELEIKALQILSDDSSYPCSIEKLITTGTLEASIRGNKVTLKALQLSPRGKSMRALYIEETTDDGLVAGLRSVAHDMHEALTFVHRHNLRHLDVRPSNIIYTRSGGRVMGCLIDFGLARQGDCSLDHFIGSVKFAHSGLLEHRRPSGHKGAVRATERLDWAALGYSLAVMKARGFISWGNLSCHNTAFDDDVNERDDVTVAALEVILGSQRSDFESVKLHKKLILSLPIEN